MVVAQSQAVQSLHLELDKCKQVAATDRMAKKAAEKETKKLKERLRNMLERCSEMNKEMSLVQRELLAMREEREEREELILQLEGGQAGETSNAKAEKPGEKDRRMRAQLMEVNKEISELQRQLMLARESSEVHAAQD